MANRTISGVAESTDDNSLRFVSICIDDDSHLAEQIMRSDRISDKVISLNKDDISQDVLEDFQTAKGCRSFLIDSFGNLEAMAPSSEISALI